MGKTEQKGEYPELAIAVSPDGQFFAVSNMIQIDVFGRKAKNTDSENAWMLIDSIFAPNVKKDIGQTPVSISFAARPTQKGSHFLVSALESEGTATGVSAAEIS